MQKIKKINIRQFILILLIPFQIFSEESIELKENELSRKKIHLYSALYTLNRYTEYPFRKRSEDFDINFLYGITNNFFVGFTYNIGEHSERKIQFVPSTYSGYEQVGEFSSSRYGEYFMLRSQYFFYKNFYGSLNAGFEKGFTKEQTKFLYIGQNVEYQPYSKITNFSHRYFGTFGVGYRDNFFENILLGIEFEFGVINSGKINDHYTFDPVYFNGLPQKYRQDLYLGNPYKTGNSEFSVISVYAGIAL
ncbi:hypothetical protein LEP1GSC202_0349 [Leptospira yanagawae serovar Saopaulo str. Sao Paulo = ATCC 700523]|uniref:Uncharacterized protein n=1 Tax=Leptospira yanagawae serovar Saopaulo str. Sao Paulo = ATCC 700523 TaxID=1249483 RepID=A0A5E8HHY7_9LEPT|nr:hypothetical protein [Leptospira yanagawae]EOQ90313.1 hypothetical protein LEP1GSC202_0349 [Leptospira yanagawae serovar Saopaulo str. Sao Paulo = ATCC 700523]